jgi:Fe-S-cluster containining protein
VESVAEIDELTLADLVPIIEASMRSQESATDELLEGVNTKAASHLYRDASNRMTGFCAASPYRGDWDCKPGCSACCSQSVPVTAVEALTVADFLRANVPPQELSDVRIRLQQNAERYATCSLQQLNDTRHRCALLDEDRNCSVHPARPLRCQGFHSFCAADCEATFQSDGDAAPPVDPQTTVAMRGIQSGLSGALRKRGKDGQYYELNSAVLRAIETPNATERWERGEDIFAGCTQPVAIPDDLWIAPQDDGSVVKLCRRENRRTGPEIEVVHITPPTATAEMKSRSRRS